MRVKAISLNPRCRIWRVSKRKSNRLNLSFQAKVRSMVNRSLYSTASKKRLRPRWVFFDIRFHAGIEDPFAVGFAVETSVQIQHCASQLKIGFTCHAFEVF